MIVDDTLNNIMSIKLMIKTMKIQDANINIIDRDDGLTGFEEFEKRNSFKNKDNIHIIIMDFYMQFMNGDEATKKICSLYEFGYQKPIIIGHSTDNDKTTMDKFKKAGSDYFEPKPPNYDNMKAIIIKEIKRRQNN